MWRSLSEALVRRGGLAALLLGAVSAAALPPLHLLVVLPVTLTLLLRLIDAAPGPGAAAWRGFWFGFGLHLFGLYWITEAILVEAARYWWLVPLAVPAVAAVLSPFVAAPAALCRLVPKGWPRVLALAGGWTLADLARLFVLSGFPWNRWGSVWAVPGRIGDVMIQPAVLAGVHGLSLATLLVALSPALGRRGMVAGAALLLAWAGFGLWRLDAPPPPAQGIGVVLVQGDVPEQEVLTRAAALATFTRYLDLTRQGVAEAAQRGSGPKVVVVWPESASPFLLETDAAARAAIAAAAGPDGLVLTGSVRFDAARRPRNSLMAVGAGGSLLGVYDKWHLVPFGEYQPDWLPIPIQVVPGGGFVPGAGPGTLLLPGLPPVGVLICYEAIFPGQIVAPGARPSWLVNITNDAWFGDSSGPRQHLAAARLRAVEEGLPLARAANTGISALFDSYGRELGRLGLGSPGVVVVALPGPLPPPPFARFGLMLPALAAGLALGLAGLAAMASTTVRRSARAA